MAHVLIAGLGDLGSGLAPRLLADGHRVSAIRRRDHGPAGVDVYAQDLAEDLILLPPDQVDLLYIILTPATRDEAGYQRSFLTAPTRLLDALQAQQPLPPVVFVSSTAVFGDGAGDMNEETKPTPSGFNGRILLAAEEELSMRTIMTSVRFSGIYGRGRHRLLHQVASIHEGAEPPAAKWTNRIHRDDCIGLLLQLGYRWLNGDMLPPVVVGTDKAPSCNLAVLNWLGEQLGTPLSLPEPDLMPGKRLHSQYIDAGHYTLKHPDFRSGYAQVLAEQ